MKLTWHILRAHAGPFFFAVTTLMFIFLLQFLMRAVDQLVGKGLSAWVITELLALSLAWMVVLAVPMAVLVATLMAFGKMSAQNEITAMKAAGMSLYRMMIPVALAAVVLTWLLIQFNNKVLPEANHRFKVLMIDIRRTKPTLTIMPGLFSQDIQGYSIIARRTFENSNDLEGVTIYDYTDPSTNVVVTAEKGRVSFTPDYRKLIMDLSDGEIHQVGTRDMQYYRRMRFTRHRIIMNAEGFDFERTGEAAIDRGDRELSAADMEEVVDSLRLVSASAYKELFSTDRPVPAGILMDPNLIRRPGMPLLDPRGAALQAPRDPLHLRAIDMALNRIRAVQANIINQSGLIEYNSRRIDEYLVEINKKYSIPVACLVFVFIGAPLGIIARRGTFGVAATLSLGFFVVYWAGLIGGEKLADRAYISPWLGMWAANIILSVVGIALTLRMGRETPTINWEIFRKLVPKSLRSPDLPAPEGGAL